MRVAGLALCALLFLVGPSVGDVSATIVPGDTVVSRLTDSGVDRLRIYVPTPAVLDVRVTGAPRLAVALGLEGPDGTSVDIARLLKGSPGRRPALRGLAVTTPGTYTLRLTADDGAGTYTVRTRLRARRSTRVDLRDGPGAAAPLSIAASSVRIDTSGTTLTTPDAQSLAVSLHNRIGTVIGSTLALNDRVTNVEGALSLTGLPGLRVAARSPAGLEFPSQQMTIVLPSSASVASSVVKRATIATATFGPGQGAGPVLAFVTWAVRLPAPSQVSSTTPDVHAVWAEVGTKRLAARRINTPLSEFIDRIPTGDAVGYFDALGLGAVPTEELLTMTHLVTYQPTDAERSAGFKVTLLLSATLPRTAEIPSYSVVVDAAAILAN